VSKNGKFRGKQGYKCKKCRKQFVNNKRGKPLIQKIWNDYVFGKQTLRQLSKKYHKSLPTVENILEKAVVNQKKIPLQKVIVTADVTFFGRGYGMLVLRSEKIKKNLYWKEVLNESPKEYMKARKEIESLGFTIEAIVLDGRKGVRESFCDMPIQMCHFHQKMILRRYLTQSPKLEAGKELRALGEALICIQEKDFKNLLSQWHEKWKEFLKEKTYDEDLKHWHYTHKRLRSAHRSLKENIPYLFTYQRYQKLAIPKTTNSLDGSFGHMKTLLKNHRGVSKKRRFKMIQEILGK